MILKDHKRPDGRAIDEIRPLAAEIDLIPRVHGSAMFTRGQTQICTMTTLAPLSEAQKLDGLDESADHKEIYAPLQFPVLLRRRDHVRPEDRDVVRSDMEHWQREHWFRYFRVNQNSHMRSVQYLRHSSPTVQLLRQVSVHLLCH